MEKSLINLTINNIPVSVEDGSTILDAAHRINMHIPTLCYHPDLRVAGNCRVCVVELSGQKELVTACSTAVTEGMVVSTNSPKVRTARKTIVELLLSEHNADCTKCYRNGNCELQWLASEYRIGDHVYHDLVKEEEKLPDTSSSSIVKDDSKCVRCQRCVRTCTDMQGVGTFSVVSKGKKQKVSTFFGKSLKDVFCIDCGQCTSRCPTAALTEKPLYEEVWDALAEPQKHVVISATPSVRVAIGQELGFEYNKHSDAKIVAALKLLGFDTVVDSGYFNDIYIMELCTEFMLRMKQDNEEKNKKVLPFITSCSQGWVSFVRTLFPENEPLLSTCKSPGLIYGALIKTYYADKKALDSKDIITVSVTPCTAAKNETANGSSQGAAEVDYALTTRELVRMIRQSGIDIERLEPDVYDTLMSMHSGASVLTEVSGGTTEAVIRTLSELVTGNELSPEWLKINSLRGENGIKETTIKFTEVRAGWEFLKDKEIRFAVVNGSGNAAKFFNDLKENEHECHFVEVMVCHGGCIGGGGQPIPVSNELIKARSSVLYALDEVASVKKAHENVALNTVYREFLSKAEHQETQKILHY
ncbi:MAG TPA: [Fe-Fe] hydrogenase large subunit C-terminal domain-containing protein [Bacteroidales bacterium]|nr:[Fe-Fe] hydrogenase large subunit C-terminal domain-containing protein [Bacteroidales bacterium]